MITWADLIFVMEKRHKQILNENFAGELQDKELIVLDIPDDYQYMDEELVVEITSKVDSYL